VVFDVPQLLRLRQDEHARHPRQIRRLRAGHMVRLLH